MAEELISNHAAVELLPANVGRKTIERTSEN